MSERSTDVGGLATHAPLLLLHTTGARTGAERVSPMMYQDLGDGRIAGYGPSTNGEIPVVVLEPT